MGATGAGKTTTIKALFPKADTLTVSHTMHQGTTKSSVIKVNDSVTVLDAIGLMGVKTQLNKDGETAGKKRKVEKGEARPTNGKAYMAESLSLIKALQTGGFPLTYAPSGGNSTPSAWLKAIHEHGAEETTKPNMVVFFIDCRVFTKEELRTMIIEPPPARGVTDSHAETADIQSATIVLVHFVEAVTAMQCSDADDAAGEACKEALKMERGAILTRLLVHHKSKAVRFAARQLQAHIMNAMDGIPATAVDGRGLLFGDKPWNDRAVGLASMRVLEVGLEAFAVRVQAKQQLLKNAAYLKKHSAASKAAPDWEAAKEALDIADIDLAYLDREAVDLLAAQDNLEFLVGMDLDTVKQGLQQ